jgi:hypothetical protein
MKLPDLTGGVCLRSDPDLFDSPKRADRDRAVQLCHSCPILNHCREAYLEFERGWSEDLRNGIVAGLNPVERAAIDKKRWPGAKAGNRPYAPRAKASA